MISKENLTEIGKFQKTHALRGELNAIINIDESYVDDGNPLIIEIDGIPVPFYVESIRPKGATSFLVKLRGIDNVEDANELVNKEIFAVREDLEPYMDEDEMLEDDLVGFEIIDEEYGRLGKLEYIDSATQNRLLVVATDTGGELFIPLVEDFILEIDEENSVIRTSIPEGLIELNSENKEDEDEV